MKKLMIIGAAALLVAGCGKSVDIDGKGMYMNTSSGIVGIGDLEIVTNPEGAEAARINYEEDTAWLDPTQKTHHFKAQLYGTNACKSAAIILRDICHSFSPTNCVSK